MHRVTLTKPFCLGAYEVTEGEWDAVMGTPRKSPPEHESILPKGDVSWDDIQGFFERLNAQYPGRGFRLPTEAEWEYAARAGTASAFSFGDDPAMLHLFGNCQSGGESNDGFDRAAPVGKFKPNAWQLYDMQGNLWEWVADRFGLYDAGQAVDPGGPAEGDDRVRRGGSWRVTPKHCEPSHRARSLPTTRRPDFGFRIAAAPAR